MLYPRTGPVMGSGLGVGGSHSTCMEVDDSGRAVTWRGGPGTCTSALVWTVIGAEVAPRLSFKYAPTRKMYVRSGWSPWMFTSSRRDRDVFTTLSLKVHYHDYTTTIPQKKLFGKSNR